MEFYQRHLCRLHPWPESLERTLAGEGTLVYQTMWGPSRVFMTGNLLHADCTPQLGEIEQPTLFTCGRYDEATPETTTWYHHLLPQSELAIFEQSAHMPHLEEPEHYLQTIRNFLRRIEQQLSHRRRTLGVMFSRVGPGLSCEVFLANVFTFASLGQSKRILRRESRTSDCRVAL